MKEYFTPEFISKMAEKYQHMTEEELIEEVKKIKQVSGKQKITDEDRKKLFEYVQPFLSDKELEQLDQLLKMFE